MSRADRTNESLALPVAQGEDDEDGPPSFRPTDGLIAALGGGMHGIEANIFIGP
jgi:hypothetical protein